MNASSKPVTVLSASILIICCFILSASAQIVDHVDWAKFLTRHDLVWNRMPDRFENAAYTGNGLLGAMIFSTDNGEALKWQMGRSDVNFKRARIPIGDFVLKPTGKIQNFTMRVDLWNAEARGTIKTDLGEIQFRSFTHSIEMVQVFETVATGKEKPTWSWEPGLAVNPRSLYRVKNPVLTDDQKNALPVRSKEGEVEVCFQALKPAGGHATAWKSVDEGNGKSVLYVGIGFSKQEPAARAEAVAAVNKGAAVGLERLAQTHRSWWHQFWPEGFVTIPDTRLESFYYIQMSLLQKS